MPSSTWKNRNIFEDVLNRENALTDALRNFLKYSPVRDALWRTLPIPENVRKRVNFSLIEAIETRPSYSRDLGEPDLVLYGSDFILVIEVKIGAELTKKHQQKAYVPWIKKEIRAYHKAMGFVVFLIPDDYPRDVLDPCLEQGRRLCRSNNSNIQVLDPITWQKLVTEFKAQDMLSLNELISEFYDHLSERFIPKPVIFSTEEIRLMHSKKTASVILKLIEIVEEVKRKSCSQGSGRLDSSGYGYHFSSPKKNKSVWFGIWWEYWAKEDFPLCVAILKKDHSSSILNAFKKQSGIKFVDFTDDEKEEWLVVGYKLPEPGKDCSELIAEIVTDIEDLLQ